MCYTNYLGHGRGYVGMNVTAHSPSGAGLNSMPAEARMLESGDHDTVRIQPFVGQDVCDMSPA